MVDARQTDAVANVRDGIMPRETVGRLSFA